MGSSGPALRVCVTCWWGPAGRSMKKKARLSGDQRELARLPTATPPFSRLAGFIVLPGQERERRGPIDGSALVAARLRVGVPDHFPRDVGLDTLNGPRTHLRFQPTLSLIKDNLSLPPTEQTTRIGAPSWESTGLLFEGARLRRKCGRGICEFGVLELPFRLEQPAAACVPLRA